MDEKISVLQKKERNINVFLAIISFGSISAWAVWDVVPWLWGLLLAISHVIHAIKPYLPFSKYAKELTNRYHSAQDIQHDFEKLWYESESKTVNESEMAKIFFSLHKKTLETFRLSEELIISQDEKIVTKANLNTKSYIKTNFNVDINLNAKI